VLGFQ